MKQTKGDRRSEQVLQAAIDVARKPGGWGLLTRQRIAQSAGCSEGLVSRYLGDMDEVRYWIMKEAVRQELLEIIVQSLVAADGYAVKKWLPAKLKRKALESILGQ